MTQSDYYKVLKKYVEVIEENGVKVEEMYFFGSRARGDEKKWSDLDVCVVSSDFTGDGVEDNKRLFYWATKVSDLIEPHAFLPEEFSDKYNFFANEIKRTGVKII